MDHLDMKGQVLRVGWGQHHLLCMKMEKLVSVPVPPCPDRQKTAIVVKYIRV